MAQLYFRYSVMDSSKSANLLMVAYNYKKKNNKIILLKPNLDTRSASGYIESRVGLKSPCIDIDKNTNIIELFKEQDREVNNPIKAILVDEAQFLTKEQVEQLAYIVDKFNVPVLAYGLKNSYIKGELFEGSKALLYYADSIEQIKNICSCGKKATMNLRVLNGNPVYEGQIINCGDTKPTDDYYIPVCRKHYFEPYKILK